MRRSLLQEMRPGLRCGMAESTPVARARALAAIRRRCSGASPVAVGRARVPAEARIVVHFHPDRLHHSQSLLSALAASGVYQSQFVTGTSNGGLTAFPGGDRFRWESRIFEGAYDEASAEETPTYGALLASGQGAASYGAAPRFGSAYLRLKPEVMERVTFCRPDSVFLPEHFGHASDLSALDGARIPSDDPLDDYTEAHLHGPLIVARDVEAIVLDPSFEGGPVAAEARLLAPVVRHKGYRLSQETLAANADYRGPEVVALGQRIAVSVLTPRDLGAFARREPDHDPQTLKRLWHCMARFGR
jgi:hypothetical protein